MKYTIAVARNWKMKPPVARARARGRAGFTLVELLVVIAIIGILASIVVPNVTKYIRKGRVTKAVSEVRNAETACAGLLSDAGVSRFRDFLSDSGRATLNGIAAGVDANNYSSILAAQHFYNQIFYELLRRGKNHSLAGILDNRVTSKLGTSYMDIGVDPWGEQYRFWMGPLPRSFIYMRSYRPPDSVGNSYLYDLDAYNVEQQRLPGNPPPDNGPGYPAPADLPVYIYSLGENQQVDAFFPIHQAQVAAGLYAPEFAGGGDDPNNWDKERGWESAPE